jgi:hypothetical protein
VVIRSLLCHHVSMVKRSSRMKKRDDYQTALDAVEKTLGASLARKKTNPNPNAVALGRLDGLKATSTELKGLGQNKERQ